MTRSFQELNRLAAFLCLNGSRLDLRRMDQEYRLGSKKVERNVLRAELSEEELWESDRYQRLQKEIQRLEREVDGEEEWEMAEP
jgi:hypothetical protein